MNVFFYRLVFLILTCITANISLAGTLILEGKYQGKNIYVINEVGEIGVGFNVYEIRVNGMVTTDEVNSLAFEIDLAQFKLVEGEYLLVEIKFKNKIPPKILNPYALTPIPTFEVASIYLDEENILHWATSMENEELQFIIQQFKWNKWVSIGKVSGKGGVNKHSYKFKPILVSGKNKLRVAQIGHNEVLRSSPEVEKYMNPTGITYEFFPEEKNIIFTDKTCYEIHNQLGYLKKRGFDKSVDVSNLKKGKYYLSFDNRTAILILK